MKRAVKVANPVPSKMEIWDMKSGKMIREHDVNNVKSSGEFLQKTIVWALSNGHGVQLYPPGSNPPLSQEE